MGDEAEDEREAEAGDDGGDQGRVVRQNSLLTAKKRPDLYCGYGASCKTVLAWKISSRNGVHLYLVLPEPRRMSSLSRTVALMTAALLGVVTVTQAAAPIPTATGNATHDRIARFSPAERNLAFDRLLRSVDHADCDVVESTFLEYRSGSFALWRAICSDGRHFVLDLLDGSDGTVAVRACDTTGEKKMRCER